MLNANEQLATQVYKPACDGAIEALWQFPNWSTSSEEQRGSGQKVRLDNLLASNSEGALSPDEVRELDRLLELADQLTILKTRARYTLSQLRVASTGS